jgi:hypothetical protein
VAQGGHFAKPIFSLHSFSIGIFHLRVSGAHENRPFDIDKTKTPF